MYVQYNIYCISAIIYCIHIYIPIYNTGILYIHVCTVYLISTDIGLRVNLSCCETFVDLMVAIEKQLQMAVQRAHYPFKAITEEVCRVCN